MKGLCLLAAAMLWHCATPSPTGKIRLKDSHRPTTYSRVLPYAQVRSANADSLYQVQLDSAVTYYSMKLEYFNPQGRRGYLFVNHHLRHMQQGLYGIETREIAGVVGKHGLDPVALHISWLTEPDPAIEQARQLMVTRRN